MRIRLLFLALLGALLAPDVAQAQSSVYICVGPPAIGACKPVDATNPLPVNATTTISGFTALTTGTPISVTTGGVTGTLPAGTVVVATNVGATNGAYCALGASATTSSQYLSPGGGWFAFTVGASTQLTCITSTSTTTVNMTGGSGIPTGTGGGGGSSGGGAVTVANGADTAEGSIGDAAYTGSGNSTVIAGLKGIYAAVTSAIPAGSATIGAVTQASGPWTVNVSQINGIAPDPCQAVAKTYTPISITTATTTRIVAPTSAKKTYICQLFLTSAAADNVGIVEGTGGTCGTGTAGVIGGATAANGPNFAANGGFSLGQGGFAVMATAGTNVDLCLITSAATPLAGSIAWVQQ